MVYSCRPANTLQKFLSSLGAKTRKSKSLKQGLEEFLTEYGLWPPLDNEDSPTSWHGMRIRYSGLRWQTLGMRDCREKEARMQDQDPPPPSRLYLNNKGKIKEVEIGRRIYRVR